jgi:hypothetical protein
VVGKYLYVGLPEMQGVVRKETGRDLAATYLAFRTAGSDMVFYTSVTNGTALQLYTGGGGVLVRGPSPSPRSSPRKGRRIAQA